MQSKKALLIPLAITAATTFQAVACSQDAAGPILTDDVAQTADEKQYFTALGKDLDQVQFDDAATLWTYTGQKDFYKDNESKKLIAVFKKYHLNVEFNGMPSAQVISNLRGDMYIFRQNYAQLSAAAKLDLTVAKFSNLFQNLAINASPNLDDIKRHVQTALAKYIAANKPQIPNEDGNDESVFEQTVNNSLFNKPGLLKAADKWWTLPSAVYQSDVTRNDVEKLFYRNLKLTNDKWGQLSMANWFKTYDTEFDKIMEDPNHTYRPIGKRPSNYSSGTTYYKDVYETSLQSDISATGNNNNGLSALYSGARFAITKSGSTYSKVFDLQTIETVVGQTFDSNLGKVINNWEHVSPASMLAMIYDGESRKSAKTPAHRTSQGDLHNLRPSIGSQFNQARSNYMFGMVSGNNYKYGAIDFEIGAAHFNPDLRVTEPRVSVRGDIARIMFYVHDRYHVTYDYQYYRQLLLWARMDPVTKEEQELDRRIAAVMGFNNDYVSGKKMLPYDAEVDQLVKLANQDQSSREFSWAHMVV